MLNEVIVFRNWKGSVKYNEQDLIITSRCIIARNPRYTKEIVIAKCKEA